VSGPAFLPTHKDDGYVIETRTIGETYREISGTNLCLIVF